MKTDLEKLYDIYKLPDSRFIGPIDFQDTNLENAALAFTLLPNIIFRGSNLKNADFLLSGSYGVIDFTNANLEGARLVSADFSSSILTGAILKGVVYSSSTIWPEGFDPKNKGMILNDEPPNSLPKSIFDFPGNLPSWYPESHKDW